MPNGLPPALYHTWLTPQTLQQLNPYNPNWPKAAQLLKSAGLHKARGAWQYAGKPLNLYIACPAGYSDWVAIAENVATQLSQFGIDAHVRTVDTTTYFSAVPTGVYPLALNFIGSSDPNPWYDYQDYVTFEGFAISSAGVVSRGKTTYNWGPLVTLPNGKTINIVKTSHDLVATNDVQQRRKDVNELALALNSQLPAIDLLYNKFYAIFVNTTRWTGFAPASDPTWGNWPVDPLSAVALTIEKGWIKPARS